MSLESTMSSPTPLSFACAEEIFGNLAVQHTAQLVANASDITLITDYHGVIRDLAFQSPALFDAVGRGWVDQRLVDVVTSECVNKVEELLGAAQRWSRGPCAGDQSSDKRWRAIFQCSIGPCDLATAT